MSAGVVPEPRFCALCGSATEMRVVKQGERTRSVCTVCGRVHYTGPRVAAGAICEKEGEILLVQRGIQPGYGLWAYPGGFVDLGETTAEGAVREAREEAGVELRITGLVGVYENPLRAVVVVVHAAEVVGGEAEALDETLAVKWARPEAIDPAELAFETTRQAFRDYLRR